MADGDSLILGTNNNAQNQTNLTVGLGDESGSYGLRVQALDGIAVGGRSAVGNGLEGISFSASGVAGTSTSDDGVFGRSTSGTGAHGTSVSGSGVRGTSFQGSAVEGFSFGLGAGVTGVAPFQTGPGVVGVSQNSFGVRGQSGAAVLLPPVGGGPQFQKCAVQGSSDEGTGVRGDSAHKVGVRGRNLHGRCGVRILQRSAERTRHEGKRDPWHGAALFTECDDGAVPEPGSLMLLAVGLTAVAWRRLRR